MDPLFTHYWIVPQETIISLYHLKPQKSAFVTPISKFEFKKVPLGLAQALPHFQQLINKVLKNLPFGYILILVRMLSCILFIVYTAIFNCSSLGSFSSQLLGGI